MVFYGDGRVQLADIYSNNEMLKWIIRRPWRPDPCLAIEMVAYGMPVGREVFDTCVWIGRYIQAWPRPDEVRLIYRKNVKLELCGSARAKDANVRQALLDRVGPRGTKKKPGATYWDFWRHVGGSRRRHRRRECRESETMTKPRILTESEIAVACEMRAQGIGRAPICRHLKCGDKVLSRSLCEIAWPTPEKHPKPQKPSKYTPSRDPWTDVPIGQVPKGHPLYEADQEMLRARQTRPTAVGGWRNIEHGAGLKVP